MARGIISPQRHQNLPAGQAGTKEHKISPNKILQDKTNFYFLVSPWQEELGAKFFSHLSTYILTTGTFFNLIFYLFQKDHLSFITDRGIEGPPDLIVEIISPSNTFSDRNTKKKTYLDFGVREYWIVDPGNKTLEVYIRNQDNPDVPHLYLAEEGEVKSPVLTELSFDLKEIFIP